MNFNTVLIGLLIIIILGLGGWYFFVVPGQSIVPTDTATTTLPTTLQPPAVPTVMAGNNVGVSISTAAVTGSVTPNGSQTTYWYEYGTSEALGTNTTPQAIGSGFVSIPTPAYITGLKANTRYFYRLAAKNAYGTVNGTTASFTTNTTPAAPATVPAATTADASYLMRTAVNLNGKVDPNGAETWYWFEWGVTEELGMSNQLVSAGAGTVARDVSAEITNLAPLTKYYFRINAQNRFGTVTGQIMSFTTLGPAGATYASPTITAASGVSTSTATLNAKVNPRGASTGVWFEYGTDAQLQTQPRTVTPQKSLGNGTVDVEVTAALTGLARNTTYYYRILALNPFGLVYSEIRSFKTNP